MSPLVWNENLDPTVEIINIQRIKIDECIKAIDHDVGDVEGSCAHICDLLNQLEQLCQLHFMYEERLLEGLNFPSIAEQKKLHDAFMKAFELIKAGSNQCHTPAFIKGFMELRLDFTKNINTETMKICDYIIYSYLGETTSMSH